MSNYLLFRGRRVGLRVLWALNCGEDHGDESAVFREWRCTVEGVVGCHSYLGRNYWSEVVSMRYLQSKHARLRRHWDLAIRSKS
jgi:hypothetical protein